jgi:type I restriction-modification system DNA methylase subunit
MADLFRTIESPYASINRSLAEAREAFHRKGRIADSNAKLDEMVKLMAIHHAQITGELDDSIYAPLLEANTFTLEGIDLALERVSKSKIFSDETGRSIFGARPVTAFEAGEEELAYELFKLAGVAISAQAQATDPLDVVNEAFGHHVRDNFRSNTEDAQYMTPPEVVEFMIALAKEANPQSRSPTDVHEPLIVCDPSCGVGSFLVSWHRMYEKDRQSQPELPQPLIIGQDKVDRMARLAKANLIFSGFASDHIFLGSSIDDASPICAYDGQIDLILTNPPFGARFEVDDLKTSSKRSLPKFSQHNTARNLDSECLFLERYLTLLKVGGLCIVVVPDGVISAKGLPAFTRQLVARSAELVAVVELPPVTFAQAGTRTKTAVLAFRKTDNPPKMQRVFFGEANDLGFEVSKRKGVALKREDGVNELPQILECFRQQEGTLSLPSGAFGGWREIEPSTYDAWTPRRFRAVEESGDGLPDNVRFEPQPLHNLVKPKIKRKAQPYKPGHLFISVLHVIGEGILDIPSMLSYCPVTPGVPVSPGSVIISRLNPRIPRVMVVPDLGKPMLCSSEFEVLEPAEGVSPYALAYLLLSQPVQTQIGSLTAGTSASHSRVRPEEIRMINLPWPIVGQEAFEQLIREYEDASRSIVDAIARITDLRAC